MKLLTNVASFGGGTFLGTQITMRIANRLQPRPMPRQAAPVLDHALRLRYRDPSETLGAYSFQPGIAVLDLGCGTGTFTEEMARMVGAQGQVHAVDIQAPLLATARQRIEAAGLADHVHFHHAGAHQLPLRDEQIDLCVLIAALSQMPDPYGVLREVWRVMRPGGQLAISEELPDPAYVPADVVESWLEQAGFRFLGKVGSPFCYSVIASKTEDDSFSGSNR